MLDCAQIQLLFFRRDQNGRRKAQRVLRRLFNRGTLKRGRRAGQPSYYCVDDYKQFEHRLGVNWAYCYLAARLHSWEEMAWEYEAEFTTIRADALATITNKVKGNVKYVFVEYDRGTEGDCAVVEKYADMEVWADAASSLLVVVEDGKRAAELTKAAVCVPGPVVVVTISEIRGEMSGQMV